MPPEHKFEVPSTTIVSPPQTQVGEVHYAGFWLRFLAFMLDNFIVGVGLSILGWIITTALAHLIGEDLLNPSSGFIIFSGLVSLTQLVLQLLYFILLTNKQQATIGKKLLGLRVVAEDGTKLTIGKIILRETVGRILSSITGVGYIMAAFTTKKQSLHDMMAHSVVISNPSERKTWAFVLSIIISAGLPIVGILASVVLVGLSSARSTATDLLVKSELSSIMSEAELVYRDSDSYATLCSDPKAAELLSYAEKAEALKGVVGKSVCNASATSYVVYVPIKNPTAPSTGLCVDNILLGPKESTEPLAGATICP